VCLPIVDRHAMAKDGMALEKRPCKPQSVGAAGESWPTAVGEAPWRKRYATATLAARSRPWRNFRLNCGV